MDPLLFIPNIQKLVLGATEVAFYLNCSTGTIYRYIRLKKLPAYKKGRDHQILTEDLLRFIKSKAHHFD